MVLALLVIVVLLALILAVLVWGGDKVGGCMASGCGQLLFGLVLSILAVLFLGFAEERPGWVS